MSYSNRVVKIVLPIEQDHRRTITHSLFDSDRQRKTFLFQTIHLVYSNLLFYLNLPPNVLLPEFLLLIRIYGYFSFKIQIFLFIYFSSLNRQPVYNQIYMSFQLPLKQKKQLLNTYKNDIIIEKINQLTQSKKLLLKAISLIIFLCVSVAVLAILFAMKFIGFIGDVPHTVYANSSPCSQYIAYKYTFNMFSTKVKIINISLAFIFIISLILFISLLIKRKGQIFRCSDNKQQQQKDKTDTSNPKANDSNISKGQNLGNQTVRDPLLQKDNKKLSGQNKNQKNNQAKNQNQNPYQIDQQHPHTNFFIILFSLMLISTVVPLAYHLSFFFQWRKCQTYIIDINFLYIFIGLEGVALILGLVIFYRLAKYKYQANQLKDQIQKLKKQAQPQKNKIQTKKQQKSQKIKNQQDDDKAKKQLQRILNSPDKVQNSTLLHQNNQIPIKQGIPVKNNQLAIPTGQTIPPSSLNSPSHTNHFNFNNYGCSINVNSGDPNSLNRLPSNQSFGGSNKFFNSKSQASLQNGEIPLGKTTKAQNINSQSPQLQSPQLQPPQLKQFNKTIIQNQQPYINSEIKNVSNSGNPNDFNVNSSNTNNPIDNKNISPKEIQMVNLRNNKPQQNQTIQTGNRNIKKQNYKQSEEVIEIKTNKMQISQSNGINSNTKPSLITDKQIRSSQQHPQKNNNNKKKLNFCSAVYSIQQASPYSAINHNVLMIKANNYSMNQSMRSSRKGSNIALNNIPNHYNNSYYPQNFQDVNNHQFQDRFRTARRNISRQEDYQPDRFVEKSYGASRSKMNYYHNQNQKYFARNQPNQRHQTNQRFYPQQRFMPSNEKHSFGEQSFINQRNENNQYSRNRNYSGQSQHYQANKMINSHNYSSGGKYSTQNEFSSAKMSNRHGRPIPLKQEVYDTRRQTNQREKIAGENEDYNSSSSYYHNSIKKQINDSYDKLKNDYRNNYTSQETQYDPFLQSLHFENKNKQKLENHNKRIKSGSNQFSMKKNKKQLAAQEQQLKKRMFDESVKYMNQQNYDSVLIPLKQQASKVKQNYRQQQNDSLFHAKQISRQYFQNGEPIIIIKDNPYPQNQSQQANYQNQNDQQKIQPQQNIQKRRLSSKKRQLQQINFDSIVSHSKNGFQNENKLTSEQIEANQYKQHVLRRRHSDNNIGNDYESVTIKPLISPKGSSVNKSFNFANKRNIYNSSQKRKLYQMQQRSQFILLSPHKRIKKDKN